MYKFQIKNHNLPLCFEIPNRLLEGWMIKLQNGCNYPFKAEVIDEQTSLNIGSVIEVEGINYIHNELGIMVNAIHKA